MKAIAIAAAPAIQAVALPATNSIKDLINPVANGQDISPMLPISEVNAPRWKLPEHISPLVTELEIKHRTAQIARRIAADLDGKPFVVVGILKGSFMFVSDLVKRFYDEHLTPKVDFLRAASYGYGDESSGKVLLQLDVSLPLKGCTVLLVDDIADTGTTMDHLVGHLKRKGASRVLTCVLLDKPSRRIVSFVPDYIGFEIPDHFVVGYGLDYAENYRNLPFIAVLEPVGK